MIVYNVLFTENSEAKIEFIVFRNKVFNIKIKKIVVPHYFDSLIGLKSNLTCSLINYRSKLLFLQLVCAVLWHLYYQIHIDGEMIAETAYIARS